MVLSNATRRAFGMVGTGPYLIGALMGCTVALLVLFGTLESRWWLVPGFLAYLVGGTIAYRQPQFARPAQPPARPSDFPASSISHPATPSPHGPPTAIA